MTATVAAPARYRHRAVKARQGWRCAGCGAANGGRDARGRIVELRVVERAGGEAALCGECRGKARNGAE